MGCLTELGKRDGSLTLAAQYLFRNQRNRFRATQRQGEAMDLRPTKMNEGAMDWCRGVNNLDRAFNRLVSARIPKTNKMPAVSSWRGSARNRPCAYGCLSTEPRVEFTFFGGGIIPMLYCRDWTANWLS